MPGGCGTRPTLAWLRWQGLRPWEAEASVRGAHERCAEETRKCHRAAAKRAAQGNRRARGSPTGSQKTQRGRFVVGRNSKARRDARRAQADPARARVDRDQAGLAVWGRRRVHRGSGGLRRPPGGDGGPTPGSPRIGGGGLPTSWLPAARTGARLGTRGGRHRPLGSTHRCRAPRRLESGRAGQRRSPRRRRGLRDRGGLAGGACPPGRCPRLRGLEDGGRRARPSQGRSASRASRTLRSRSAWRPCSRCCPPRRYSRVGRRRRPPIRRIRGPPVSWRRSERCWPRRRPPPSPTRPRRCRPRRRS